jgi:hypothetical protein
MCKSRAIELEAGYKALELEARSRLKLNKEVRCAGKLLSHEVPNLRRINWRETPASYSKSNQ